MHPRHYSPRTPLFLVANGNLPDEGQGQCQGVYLQLANPPKRPNISSEIDAKIAAIQMPTSATDYAAALYEKLHQADAANADWIAVDQPPNAPEWEAVQDRLKRAASKGTTS
jgi:L-threonylcarbamoyladenylate synthase